MILRYNPHLIVKSSVGELCTRKHDSLETDIRSRIAGAWQSGDAWSEPYLPRFLPADVVAEYGIDAVRLSYITDPNDQEIIESVFKWLAAFHNTFLSPVAAKSNPSDWIQAIFTVRDHVLLRNKLYPALACLRKTWKNNPITFNSANDEKIIALLLLMPFAPMLSRWLLESIECWPPPAIPDILKRFPNHRPVKITMEAGGRCWIVTDSKRFAHDPCSVLKEIPWVKKAFGNVSLSFRETEDGWKISPGPRMQNEISG